MEVNSTVFTTNFQHNNYIYNCDFVNKYAIKSIYKNPKIQKIVISFSIDQLKKSEISENDRIVSLKSFFILYTLFFFKPFCSYTVLENKRIKVENVNEKIDLKITLSNKEEIACFLRTLFIENGDRILEENFNLFNSKKNLSKQNSNQNFCKKVSLSCYSLFELDQLLKKLFNRVNTKEIFFDINFYFSNIPSQQSKNCIKNIPFFWING
jgi:hypothetical protein